MKRRLVPFRREIRFRTHGGDVIALKRALSRAKLLTWRGKLFSPVMGPVAVRALKNFQRRVKIAPDGVYGPRTHAALARHRWKGVQAYDSYSAYLMGSAKILTATQKRQKSERQREIVVRQKIVALCWLSYSKRWAMNYTQTSLRWWGLDRGVYPPEVPLYSDCSSWLSWVYKRAGVTRDPSGSGWDDGYTGSLKENGVRVQVPQIGDESHYGGGTGTHVAIYIGGGREMGNGSQPGPSLTRTKYREDWSEYRDAITGNV